MHANMHLKFQHVCKKKRYISTYRRMHVNMHSKSNMHVKEKLHVNTLPLFLKKCGR